MYQLYLKFDQLPVSLNKKLRSHRFKNHKENNQWDAIISCLASGKKPIAPLEKCSIVIVRHFYRFLDYDGCVGSMKPVIDGLKFSGIIKDDSYEITGPWHVTQIFRPKNMGPLLEITISAPQF